MLLAMIKKEFLLIFRDKHALGALFIMPSIFILVMSMALKDEFNTNRALLSYSIVNEDNKTFADKLITLLSKNPKLKVSSEDSASYILTIPKGFSRSFKATSKKSVSLHVAVRSDVKPAELSLFKAQVMQAYMQLKLEAIKTALKKRSSSAAKKLDALNFDSDTMIQSQYKDVKEGQLPTSTQQSVPMWIVFGLFFVVIPISTVVINERKENTLLRLHTMNLSITTLLIGKIVPYLLINQIQIWLMIAVGIFIVPLLGADALTLGDSISALILLSLSLSLGAITMALFIASTAKTTEQATTIGGIINILLGAIGGLMVPKHIMPPSMQSFADISPMSWGFEGYLDIFLRHKGVVDILGHVALLLGFAIILFLFSVLILRYRLSKGM